MRTRATLFGVILLLALARPAAAQFSSTMGTTMTGATGTTTTTSSFFSNLLGTRTSVPKFNHLSVFPAAPKTYGTMLGRTPTGTTPQVMVVMPSQQASPMSFFRKKQSN